MPSGVTMSGRDDAASAAACATKSNISNGLATGVYALSRFTPNILLVVQCYCFDSASQSQKKMILQVRGPQG